MLLISYCFLFFSFLCNVIFFLLFDFSYLYLLFNFAPITLINLVSGQLI